MEPIYLYILMRTDMASMNAGKAVIQGTHAANQCVFEGRAKQDPDLTRMLDKWEAETAKGFGTGIALGVNAASMYTAVMVAKALGFHAGICHDPSYPLVDGEVCHLIPLDTCAYVFGPKDALRPVLGNFKLMP